MKYELLKQKISVQRYNTTKCVHSPKKKCKIYKCIDVKNSYYIVITGRMSYSYCNNMESVFVIISELTFIPQFYSGL